MVENREVHKCKRGKNNARGVNIFELREGKKFHFRRGGDMFAVPIYQRPLEDIIQYLLNTVPVKD